MVGKGFSKKSPSEVVLFFLAMLAVVGLTWANYNFAQNNPGGNDFLVHYIGTRALLFEGTSPYKESVAIRIQNTAYGHPAQEGEHELRVAYPLYSAFLFSPFALISNYVVARAIWMTILEMALILGAYINLRTTNWHPKLWLQAFYFLFAILWYHAVRGVINGNAVILVSFLISLFFYAVQRNNDSLAGVLLALTTIKPHLVILLVIFTCIWALYRSRWALFLWFLGTMAVLVIGGMLLVPNWIQQNIWEILRFPSYNPVLTLGEALGEWIPAIRNQIPWVIALVLGLLLIAEWWATRNKSFSHYLWACCLTLTVGQWIGIPTDPGNFIILFPALTIVLATWEKRWGRSGEFIVTGLLLSLLVGLWLLFITSLEKAYQPIQAPIMFIPLPAFMILGLYWVRWWIISPVHSVFNVPMDIRQF
jgi:hypothetical protein